MTNHINDKFQARYVEHQQHKKMQLVSNYGEKNIEVDPNMKESYLKLLKNRRSQRTFNSKEISQEDLNYLLSSLVELPSSCNRQAISIKVVEDRTSKELLGGLLVGGAGWCHRANKMILLFAQ